MTTEEELQKMIHDSQTNVNGGVWTKQDILRYQLKGRIEERKRIMNDIRELFNRNRWIINSCDDQMYLLSIIKLLQIK